MNIKRITALEFLDAARKAECNGDDKPAFSQIVEALKQFPQTKQRLVFEILAMARQSLELKTDPGPLVLWAVIWSESIDQERLSEYFASLEEFIFRYFELLGQRQNPPEGVHPFIMPLMFALRAVSKRDRYRSEIILNALRNKCDKAKLDSRYKIVCEIERLISQE